jgi:hypothetical protein
MSKKAIDPKATITVADYLTLERLIRERPSVSNLEKAVQLFPTCAIFWSTYLDYLYEAPEKALRIAERAVVACPHVDLWRRYLTVAKQMYRLPELFPLFEKAVSSIGIDAKSSDIWIEYLYVLRAVYNTQVLVQFNCLENPAMLPPTAILVPVSPIIPAGLNEDMLDTEGLKLVEAKPTITTLRETFQAALVVPMDRIDAIWDEYQAFEQVIANSMAALAQNAPTIGGLPPPALIAGVQASKLLTEYSSRYAQSKQGFKELVRIYAPINSYFAPLPLDAVNTAETLKPNILAWRRVVQFEKKNPFKLSWARFKARMQFVFTQCLLSNVYVSDFWIEKFVWVLSSEGGFEPALHVLQNAVSNYLAHDVMLRVLIAFVLEETNQISKCAVFYKDSISHFTAFKRPVPALLMHYIRFASRSQSPVHARTVFLDHVKNNSIHLLDFKVFIAFAKLELRSMNNPSGALKVIQMGLKKFSSDLDAYSQLSELMSSILSNKLVPAAGSGGEQVDDSHDLLMTGKTTSSSILSKSFEDAQSWFEMPPSLTFLGNAEAGIDFVDISGEKDRFFGGLKRPDVQKMQPFRPGMEEDQLGEAGSKRARLIAMVPKPLQALINLLPESTETVSPETDTLVKVLQTISLPKVSVGAVRRLDEDPNVDQIRREREDKEKINLKRLLDAKNDDVIIKSDYLLDDERAQREFLSALASNIHRERVYYKRHKLLNLVL